MRLFLTNLILRWKERKQRRLMDRHALELDRAEVARRWGETVNKAQRTALDYHCRLATETMHPRFARLIGGGIYTVVLTVNSGYE
jgi:hypothetical protein